MGMTVGTDLLENQPSSVQSRDFGKAVAVHAGSHPNLASRYLGFNIRKAFE
jgi:hypothetical protein